MGGVGITRNFYGYHTPPKSLQIVFRARSGKKSFREDLDTEYTTQTSEEKIFVLCKEDS
jgi:hypothetical protein